MARQYTNRREQVVAAIKSGRHVAEVAAEFCIKETTARRYVTEFATTARKVTGPSKKCWCGLRLPCTCTGPFRAVEYARRESNLAAVI